MRAHLPVSTMVLTASTNPDSLHGNCGRFINMKILQKNCGVIPQDLIDASAGQINRLATEGGS
jgi:hypothetical protein